MLRGVDLREMIHLPTAMPYHLQCNKLRQYKVTLESSVKIQHAYYATAALLVECH
jgi:hypothetical protein